MTKREIILIDNFLFYRKAHSLYNIYKEDGDNLEFEENNSYYSTIDYYGYKLMCICRDRGYHGSADGEVLYGEDLCSYCGEDVKYG